MKPTHRRKGKFYRILGYQGRQERAEAMSPALQQTGLYSPLVEDRGEPVTGFSPEQQSLPEPMGAPQWSQTLQTPRGINFVQANKRSLNWAVRGEMVDKLPAITAESMLRASLEQRLHFNRSSFLPDHHYRPTAQDTIRQSSSGQTNPYAAQPFKLPGQSNKSPRSRYDNVRSKLASVKQRLPTVQQVRLKEHGPRNHQTAQQRKRKLFSRDLYASVDQRQNLFTRDHNRPTATTDYIQSLQVPSANAKPTSLQAGVIDDDQVMLETEEEANPEQEEAYQTMQHDSIVSAAGVSNDQPHIMSQDQSMQEQSLARNSLMARQADVQRFPMLAVSNEPSHSQYTHPAVSEQMAQQLQQFQQQMQGATALHIDTVVGNVNIMSNQRRKSQGHQRASVNAEPDESQSIRADFTSDSGMPHLQPVGIEQRSIHTQWAQKRKPQSPLQPDSSLHPQVNIPSLKEQMEMLSPPRTIEYEGTPNMPKKRIKRKKGAKVSQSIDIRKGQQSPRFIKKSGKSTNRKNQGNLANLGSGKDLAPVVNQQSEPTRVTVKKKKSKGAAAINISVNQSDYSVHSLRDPTSVGAISSNSKSIAGPLNNTQPPTSRSNNPAVLVHYTPRALTFAQQQAIRANEAMVARMLSESARQNQMTMRNQRIQQKKPTRHNQSMKQASLVSQNSKESSRGPGNSRNKSFQMKGPSAITNEKPSIELPSKRVGKKSTGKQNIFETPDNTENQPEMSVQASVSIAGTQRSVRATQLDEAQQQRKVHFQSTDDGDWERVTGKKIKRDYEAMFGPMSKFINYDSPIDRYYKQYVLKPHAEKARESPLRKKSHSPKNGSPKDFRRTVADTLGKPMEEIGLMKSLDPKELLPKGEYERAQAAVNKFKTVEEAYVKATNDPDSRAVKAILHLQSEARCNCGHQHTKLIEQRLSQPYATKKRGQEGAFPADTLPEDLAAARVSGLDIKRDDSPNLTGEAARKAYEFALRRSRQTGMCRRGCSTTHNPLFHSTRIGMKIEEPKKQAPIKDEKTSAKDAAKARLNKLNMGMVSMMNEEPVSIQEDQKNFLHTARESPIRKHGILKPLLSPKDSDGHSSVNTSQEIEETQTEFNYAEPAIQEIGAETELARPMSGRILRELSVDGDEKDKCPYHQDCLQHSHSHKSEPPVTFIHEVAQGLPDIVKRLSPRRKIKELATWEERKEKADKIIQLTSMKLVDQVKLKIKENERAARKKEEGGGSETSFEKPEEVIEDMKPTKVQSFTPYQLLDKKPHVVPGDPKNDARFDAIKRLDEFAKPDNLDTKGMKELMQRIHAEETSMNLIDQLSMASPMINANKIIPNLMSQAEAQHLYDILRKAEQDPTVAEETADKLDKGRLRKKAWATLEFLMTSLMLGGEYDMVLESAKAKERADQEKRKEYKISPAELEKRQDQRLIKALLRCLKMFDAKQMTITILLKARRRESFFHLLLESQTLLTVDRAQIYYFIALKNSCKLFNMIARLRKDHALLQRPFIYNKENLQHVLVKDMLNLRRVLIKQFNELVASNALDRVLNRKGKIIQITDRDDSAEEDMCESSCRGNVSVSSIHGSVKKSPERRRNTHQHSSSNHNHNH